MIAGSLARRYAKAVLAIGIETRQLEQYGQELADVAALATYKPLRATLENPSHSLARRKAVLDDLLQRLRPSRTVRNLVLLLADRQRLALLPALALEYRRLADQHAGRLRASVTSAQPLDEEHASQLQQALEQRTGKHVLLDQHTDPELIAGIVTRIGSMVYDGSLRTRLQQMRQTLLRAAE